MLASRRNSSSESIKLLSQIHLERSTILTISLTFGRLQPIAKRRGTPDFGRRNLGPFHIVWWPAFLAIVITLRNFQWWRLFPTLEDNVDGSQPPQLS